MDENGIWLEDQNVILQVFLKEFYKSFQKDRNVNIQRMIPLSEDVW